MFLLTTCNGKKILCGSIEKTFLNGPYFPGAFLWKIENGTATFVGRYLKYEPL